MKKIISGVAIMLLMTVVIMCLMTGCGAQGIDGEWVLVKEIESDGNVIDEKGLEELGVSEVLKIEDGNVHYTCSVTLMDKPVELDMILKDEGNDTYSIGTESFDLISGAKLKGNTLSYYAGEGDDRIQMIYKRR